MTFSLRDGIRILHVTALFVVAVFAFAAVFYTLLCIAGLADWLDLTATLGGVPYPNAGPWIQGALTAMLGAMAFFLPTTVRMLALENSHRNFHIRMDDVARAYHAVHAADRAGVFTLSSEFDAVRDRLAYLRDHPDLPQLEGGVLEVAAQMSVQSRHLAEVYSVERVARAKAFLRQRQQAAEEQQERIVEALHICEQIRAWSDQVEIEEARVASQLTYLDDRLQSTLPLLGYALEHDERLDAASLEAERAQQEQRRAGGTNIVPMPQKPAAE
ncbi:DNA repair protein [Loktanella sp. M215]|uniref:DNA repair protein n=1 Tax=Loktanella sp. M215 TaxID=2675431 RepID=UPI001F194600|nr:DNA repair protein [Loktanella sp. M215]